MRLLVLVLLISATLTARGQGDCRCDLTITKSGTYTQKATGIQPGQTVCIQAGQYANLYFLGFVGTQDKPIRFVNCGGQVVLESTKLPSGLQFYGCQHFLVSGSGDNGLRYGIRINQSAAQALGVAAKSSDCEIERVEVAGAYFAGFMVKTDPAACDSTTWRENFVMRNVKIHDNYIHDVGGEGLYIGNSFWDSGLSLSCNGTPKKVYPHNILGLEIHHNIVIRTEAEGIQYGCAPDAEVHHNLVSHTGISPFALYQDNGVQIGAGSGGRFYNNQVTNVRGVGIAMIGNIGNTAVFNNVIQNCGVNSIFCDDRAGSLPGTPMWFVNNTLINSGQEAIKLYNEINVNLIANNVIAGVGAGRRFIFFLQGAKATQLNNFTTAYADSAGFVNASGGNFRLRETSPLVDAGGNVTMKPVPFDLDDNLRPFGRRVDIGAYEFYPELSQTLTLYPSPCTDQISVLSKVSLERVAVYSLTGAELVRVEGVAAKAMTLPVGKLPTGLYIVRAETANGPLSGRFLKQ